MGHGLVDAERPGGEEVASDRGSGMGNHSICITFSQCLPWEESRSVQNPS